MFGVPRLFARGRPDNNHHDDKGGSMLQRTLLAITGLLLNKFLSGGK